MLTRATTMYAFEVLLVGTSMYSTKVWFTCRATQEMFIHRHGVLCSVLWSDMIPSRQQ